MEQKGIMISMFLMSQELVQIKVMVQDLVFRLARLIQKVIQQAIQVQHLH